MPLTISVVIAAGAHLFPFRTEKLSPPAPMVLGGQPPGRVGRRRLTQAGAASRLPLFCARASRGNARRRRRRALLGVRPWSSPCAHALRGRAYVSPPPVSA